MTHNDKILNLTGIQEFALATMGGNGKCACTSTAIQIHGAIDINRLEQAIRKTVEKNDIFRWTILLDDDGKYKQKVSETCEFELKVYDVPGDTLSDKKQKIFELSNQIMSEVSLLCEGLLYRFVLFDLKEDEYILFAAINHIVTDGVGNDVTMISIISEYNGVDFSTHSASFREYVEEANAFADSEEGKKQIEFWENEIKGYCSDFVSVPKTNKKLSARKALTTIDIEPVKTFARENKTSVFNVVLYLYHLALAATYNIQDTMINVANGNRNKKYRQTIGFLTTTFNSKMNFDREISIKDLFAKFMCRYQKAQQNSAFGFKCASETMFTISYLNYTTKSQMMLGSATIEPFIGIAEPRTWNVFALVAMEMQDRIIFEVGCDSDGFPEKSLQKFAAYIHKGVKHLCEDDISFNEFCKLTGE